MESHGDNACHVNLHILDPHFLSETASHDVASIICQALPGGLILSLVWMFFLRYFSGCMAWVTVVGTDG